MLRSDGEQVFTAIARRVIFAGLVLLFVWLILLALRGAIPERIIDLMNSKGRYMKIPSDSATWDWSRSIWQDAAVSEIIGPRLGITLRLIGLTGLFSLALSAVLLFLGAIFSRITEHPGWLARVRSIFRLVLISGGASTPVLTAGAYLVIFLAIGWEWSLPENTTVWIYWTAFFASLLPAWLLVQAGHGELSKLPEDTHYLMSAKHLAVRLVIRLLRLIGVIIVVTIPAGGLLLSSAFPRDFPVLFQVVWIFVVIVVLIKLLAVIIEIVYERFSKYAQSAEPGESSLKSAIPKGWLIFSLGLVGIIVLVAVVGPFLAPYSFNEISIADRLAPPSAEHLLGADNLGRDILSRVLYGVRIDVLAGLACTVSISVLGFGWAVLADLAGRAGGWLGRVLEDLVMLPVEIIRAFPWLILLFFLVSILVTDNGIVPVTLVISLVLLPRAVAMIREAHQPLPEMDGWLRGLLRALPVVVIFTVGASIIYNSTLGYFGLGIHPPYPELGSMIASSGRQYMLEAPWIARWPAVCLVLLLLIWVMAGDALLERLGFRSKAVWAKTME